MIRRADSQSGAVDRGGAPRSLLGKGLCSAKTVNVSAILWIQGPLVVLISPHVHVGSGSQET